MSRQNYYAQRRRRRKSAVDNGLIIELVKRERRRQPRLGGRKLLVLLKNELESKDALIGRDRFFDVLRANNYLLERKKAFIPKTTRSKHSLPVFRNLTADLEATAPNQIWVSDLTYIRTEEGFVYGALITDDFSRNIVGAYAGDNLESVGCINALNKALKDLPANRFPIHHSDRGCQYCCHAYVDLLRGQDISISMTEANHCYENAKAERINGILKQEYGLDQTFKTKDQAKVVFYEAVELYNHYRPHMSLNMKCPAEVHYEEAA